MLSIVSPVHIQKFSQNKIADVNSNKLVCDAWGAA